MTEMRIYTNAELRHLIRMMRLAPLKNKQARLVCKRAVDYLRCRKAFKVDK